MKKVMVSILVAVFTLNIFVGCKKRSTDEDYFGLAYENMGKEQWSEAERYFQKVLNEYPDGNFSSKSLFMVGFINANYLKNYEKAEKYYNDFISKYPDHELVESAKYEIKHLGENIDDLEFLKKEMSEGDSVVAQKTK
jgi:outer membrane protein assembly factor BamD (BamD/ComL family)